MTPVVFGGLLILLIVIILVLIAAMVWQVQRALRAQARGLQQRFPQALIAPANFYGQESARVTQMRGNGTLVLTDTELYFERLWPRREYRIPLAAIEAIETPKSYLGKTNFQPLLKVVFRNEAGELDSIAWLVADVEGWQQRLDAAGL